MTINGKIIVYVFVKKANVLHMFYSIKTLKLQVINSKKHAIHNIYHTILHQTLALNTSNHAKNTNDNHYIDDEIPAIYAIKLMINNNILGAVHKEMRHLNFPYERNAN